MHISLSSLITSRKGQTFEPSRGRGRLMDLPPGAVVSAGSSGIPNMSSTSDGRGVDNLKESIYKHSAFSRLFRTASRARISFLSLSVSLQTLIPNMTVKRQFDSRGRSALHLHNGVDARDNDIVTIFVVCMASPSKNALLFIVRRGLSTGSPRRTIATH